jgi:hypothetical protein
MLNKFFEFYLERLLENKTNTKLPLYYTDRFRNLLKRIDDGISDKLLAVENSGDDRYQYTRTYVDIDEKSIDKISFIMVNKIKDVINNKYPENNSTDYREDYLRDEYVDAIYNARQRSIMKINRFVNEVTKNQYITKPLTEEEKEYNRKHGIQTNPQKLEIFVNKFKSFRKPGKFELVTGDDIVYWYYQDRYAEGSGTLNSSCMKGSNCSGYLQFYANNKKVSLLIMKDREDDTKIIGRALVWKLDLPEDRIFMDRVYTVDQSDVEMFIDYATKNEWLYKYRQNMDSDEFIVDSKTGEKEKPVLYINEVIDSDDGEYPYLDTLKYYDRDHDDILTNHYEMLSGDFITLEGTHGEYTTGGHLSYEELVERYIDDILDDFEYYAKDFMQSFIWDYVDDKEFANSYISDYMDSELEDFEYIWDEDDIIEYFEKFVKSGDTPENLDEMDKDELFELVDKLDIRYEMTEWRLNDRYDGESAKDILEEMYGYREVEEMPQHIWDSISHYVDERACAEAYAENEDEDYLRDRYSDN